MSKRTLKSSYCGELLESRSSCDCFEAHKADLLKRMQAFRDWLEEQIDTRKSFIDNFATMGVDNAMGGFTKDEKKRFKEEKKLYENTLLRFDQAFGTFIGTRKHPGRKTCTNR